MRSTDGIVPPIEKVGISRESMVERIRVRDGYLYAWHSQGQLSTEYIPDPQIQIDKDHEKEVEMTSLSSLLTDQQVKDKSLSETIGMLERATEQIRRLSNSRERETGREF